MSEPMRNVEEAAAYLRISVKTLYKLTAARSVPFTRIGKKTIVFSQEHLDAIVEAGYQAPITAPTRLQVVTGRDTHPPSGPSTPPPPPGPKALRRAG